MPVSCEALAVFALNPVSHRSLKAAATFQSTLNLLSCLRSVEKSRFDTFETKELVRHSLSLQPAILHIFRHALHMQLRSVGIALMVVMQ